MLICANIDTFTRTYQVDFRENGEHAILHLYSIDAAMTVIEHYLLSHVVASGPMFCLVPCAASTQKRRHKCVYTQATDVL